MMFEILEPCRVLRLGTSSKNNNKTKKKQTKKTKKKKQKKRYANFDVGNNLRL